MRRAGKWLWGALSVGGAIQFAFWFLGAAIGIVVAGFTDLSTALRIALGVAVFGFVFFLSFALLPLLPASLRPKPKSAPPSPTAASSPVAQAAQLQRNHEDKVVKERRAMRKVREELRDNRRLLQRAGENEPDALDYVSDSNWRALESTMLDFEDPDPHAAAKEAYRELSEIERARMADRDLLDTDKETALEAIDNAISVLSLAESKRSR